MKSILVATNNRDSREIISACFIPEYRVEETATYESCLEKFKSKRYEYLFLDVGLLHAPRKNIDYKTELQSFWRIFPSVEIIVLSTQEMVREAVRAVKAGASDYLTYPLDIKEVKLVIDTIDENVRLQSELDYHRDKSWRGESLSILRTNSPVLKKVFDQVQSVAQTESTVLLTGETGTGKGLVANLIHQRSRRRENQFISIHCGAIPDTLLESELFGHEKGAFTGAVRRKLGKFEIASGGTIFLDEIGTVSSAMQIKLLRVLQDRSFERVGGEVTIEADVRIIAATNADLKAMCEAGTFRQDLYYRLNVFPIEIPPLRERIDDIPLLVEQIIKKLNRFGTKEIVDVDPYVMSSLQSYSWPGNIRELENLVERASIIEKSSILTRNSFPGELFKDSPEHTLIDTNNTLGDVRKREIARIERKYLTELLRENGGKINSTAMAAGIGVRQLHKLMTKYGLSRNDFT
ncbi:MAG: sigma-54-dependent Fis family transcriptional regulator [Calditrichaeota bacterium]|nr:MAG: sigma-54-dependent Fis family transcriptional regulator [Calditrichota bacterium]